MPVIAIPDNRPPRGMIQRNFSLGSFLNFGGAWPSTFLILRERKYLAPPPAEVCMPEAPPHTEGVGVENGFGVALPEVEACLGVAGGLENGALFVL